MQDDRLRRYCEYFEQLSPAALADLDRVMTEDVHFVDPFNDVTGIEPTRRVFAHMYRDLDAPVFRVLQAGLAEQDPATGLLRWRLDGTVKKGGAPLRIDGMSEIRFAADGRVNWHVDHWDAGRQIYERIPVLGSLVRVVRRRLAA